jgi:hypothetical protein
MSDHYSSRVGRLDRLYVSEHYSSRVGRLDRLYCLIHSSSRVGRLDRLYVSDHYSSRVGRLDRLYVSDHYFSRVGRLDRLYVSEQYCSRVGKCAMTPVGFSDHHIVTVDIHLSCPRRSSPYWYFNVKLLHDVMFCDRFLLFWEKWRVTKGNFESLRQWWEVGKAQIRVFCQQYTALSQIEVKETIKVLEQDIKSIKLKLLTQNDTGLVMNLQDKRHELGLFLLERVKGALIRSRFASLEDMDAPSALKKPRTVDIAT